jgi:7-keto-8-aminopelargonate synthetase-like enzyme
MGRMKVPKPLQQTDRTYVRFAGGSYSYFAGCDYFRLASHPRVLRAAGVARDRYGLNVAASRMTTGNHKLHDLLEKKLAEFFAAESATLASSGYAPNILVAQAIAGTFSHVLMDERAHGSLVDAAQFMECPVVKFKHRDAASLQVLLARLGKIKPILFTDGMFSHHGGVAPLKAYLKILPADAFMLVDDAHGAGVLGKNGRGAVEHEGVARHRVIQCITLSKAFGVYGGAVLGSRQLRDQIIARSRMFTGNTPLPLPLAGAAIESLAILKSDKKLQTRLWRNIHWLRDRLKSTGTQTAETYGPILAVIPENQKEAQRLKTRLMKHRIFPSLIKYPGGPEGGYFRFVISSEHTREQLAALAGALAECAAK